MDKPAAPASNKRTKTAQQSVGDTGEAKIENADACSSERRDDDAKAAGSHDMKVASKRPDTAVPSKVSSFALESAASTDESRQSLPEAGEARASQSGKPTKGKPKVGNDKEPMAGSDEEPMAGSDEEDEEAKKAFYRKRNAMYSRRKYMRKKIEIEVLQTQKADLMNENRHLTSEESRLAALLEQAKQLVASIEAKGPIHGGGRGGMGSVATVSHSTAGLGGAEMRSLLPASAQEALTRFQQLQQERLRSQGTLPPAGSLGMFEEQLLNQQMLNRVMADASREQGTTAMDRSLREQEQGTTALDRSLLQQVDPNLNLLHQGLLPLEQLQQRIEFSQPSLQLGLSQQQRQFGLGLSQALQGGADYTRLLSGRGTAAATPLDIASIVRESSSQPTDALRQQQQQASQQQQAGLLGLSGLDAATLLRLRQQQPPSGASSLHVAELLEFLRRQQQGSPR